MSMGSQQPEPKRNSQKVKCRDCGVDFDSEILGGKFGRMGLHHFTDNRCDTCNRNFLDNYQAEQRRIFEHEKAKKNAQKAIELLGGLKPYEEFTFERFNRDLNPHAFDRAAAFNPASDNLFFYGKVS